MLLDCCCTPLQQLLPQHAAQPGITTVGQYNSQAVQPIRQLAGRSSATMPPCSTTAPPCSECVTWLLNAANASPGRGIMWRSSCRWLPPGSMPHSCLLPVPLLAHQQGQRLWLAVRVAQQHASRTQQPGKLRSMQPLMHAAAAAVIFLAAAWLWRQQLQQQEAVQYSTCTQDIAHSSIPVEHAQHH